MLQRASPSDLFADKSKGPDDKGHHDFEMICSEL